MINSGNEHSHSKRCNNCSGTTFRPRRSSSGTKLRVIGKDWSLYTVHVDLTVYKDQSLPMTLSFVPDEDLRGRNVVPLQLLHLLLCEVRIIIRKKTKKGGLRII